MNSLAIAKSIRPIALRPLIAARNLHATTSAAFDILTVPYEIQRDSVKKKKPKRIPPKTQQQKEAAMDEFVDVESDFTDGDLAHLAMVERLQLERTEGRLKDLHVAKPAARARRS
ncbi:uncharacterized protein VTP21DRAFT_2481 [Calcarisporiella thermophila]|uniref:uncharacterized protein n=1 Tax=Calcarisporiella thermophila TaxID=911321 RepID=UPI00374337C6